MDNDLLSRRRLLTAAVATGGGLILPGTAAWAQATGGAAKKSVAPATAAAGPRPFRVYAITFRGVTDVERGFEEHFLSRKIPIQMIYRDLNRDMNRMKGYIDEIRSTKPDLVYTWGTTVTLGAVGPVDTKTPEKFISDVPVVFTLVAEPRLAKIVDADGKQRPNVTGVVHIAPVAAQVKAMSDYRPFKTLGVLFNPTEENSVVVINELRKIAKEKGFDLVERTFKLDANKRPMAEGAQDMVRELREAKAQWLYLPPDSYLGTLAQDLVIPTAMMVGIPTFASTEQLMQAGALSGLISRYHSVGQFTGFKAEEILVGKKAASDVPVETLKRFSLQIRINAAERLKLMPPLPMFNYAEIINDAPIAQ
jgi:putative tryptophan/tyrosine transport system substrate-binding protein